MSLEDAIKGNTEAIIALTEALIKLHRNTEPEIEKFVKEHIPTVDGEEYLEAKAMIKALTPTHRDEIKALNVKYGLKVFADILVDIDDPSKGVKDVDKFLDYVYDLKQLTA